MPEADMASCVFVFGAGNNKDKIMDRSHSNPLHASPHVSVSDKPFPAPLARKELRHELLVRTLRNGCVLQKGDTKPTLLQV